MKQTISNKKKMYYEKSRVKSKAYNRLSSHSSPAFSV